MDHARICSLLEAKDRIERTLIECGVGLDAEGRAAIGWALKALTEDEGYSVAIAAQRILEVHRRTLAEAA